jgi:hypothetical protein
MGGCDFEMLAVFVRSTFRLRAKNLETSPRESN